MKLKTLYIVLLLLFILVNIQAQTNNTEMPKFIPPSPTVAGMEKYGDYPIGYNTGTVNISADLYSFPLGKGLTLDVGLSYHSSGIKVEETSGRVGLGWSLMAGGYISRQVKGVKDEGPGGFYNFIQKHKGYKFPNLTYDYAANTADSIAKGWLDSAPDIFSLNILGRSYKFFLGNDGEFHTIPYSNVKFNAHPLTNRDGSGGWEITDESGNRYIFGNYEQVTSPIISGNVVVSWWLNSIISPEGNILASFEYNFSAPNYHNVTRHSMAYLVSSEGWVAQFPSRDGTETSFSSNPNPYEACDLKQINIPGKGSIVIDASTARSDQSWKLISEIRYLDNNKVLTNKYSFTYEQRAGEPYLTKILKTGSDGTTIKYRTFDYYPGLPGYNSYAQDFWGYYNGKTSNRSLYPYVDSFFDKNFTRADRYPTKDAIAGTIKEIIYPSGGKTLFEFENNKIDGTISEVIRELKVNTINHTQSDYGELSSPSFTTITQNVNMEIDMSIHPAGLYSVDVRLVNVNTGQLFLQFNDASVTRGDFVNMGTNPDGTRRFVCKYTNTPLAEGTYKWITKITSNDDRPNKPKPYPIKIYNNYYTVASKNETHENIVGGLRIAQISNYDRDGGLIGKTRYSYLNKAGVCSGFGSPRPRFLQSYVITEDLSSDIIPKYRDNKFLEVGETDLTNYTGSPVQYTFVTEEKIGYDQGTIKTEYEYQRRDFIRNPMLPIGDYNYTPYSLNDYEEGLLLYKTDYEFKDNTYVPVRKETNTYTVKNTGTDIPSFTAISLEKYMRQFYFQVNITRGTFDKYILGMYDIKSAKVYLSSQKVEETTPTGMVTTISNYYYNNPVYQQPTSTIQYNSNGVVNETINKYSYDYNTNISNDMTVKNMISKPFKIDTKVNNVATSSVEFTYGYFNTTPIIELQNIKESTLTSIPRILQYNQYDSYGNPLYVTKDNITQVVYLWSYNGQYPIAEINIMSYTYAEIENIVKSVFSVTSIDALSKQATPTEAKLKDGSLQNALPNALVTTYTYKPLSRVSSITDPREVTTYYDYDSFGRLKETYIIENGVKKVIQVNEYHYQNQ